MKNTFSIFIISVISITNGCLFSQNSQFFTTSENRIIDPCGSEFIMRGVNYSLADDWNFPGNLNSGTELSSQIILANPNTVRIQWYVDYGQPARPALTLSALDSVISRFSAANIVSVLELHDFTHIHTDTTAFNNQVVGWWTSQPVLDLIEKHKSHIFVNVANEYGPAMYIPPMYNLNPNYNAEVSTWVTHYKNVIIRLRNAGIEVPIMIDGPNYGMDYQTVINHATEFNNHDPLNRIVMSCHAYWDVSASNMTSIVNQLSALTVPVIFGEVGNVNFPCDPIEMNSLLTACQDKKMGWLAWTWNRDECVARNMTTNEPNVPNHPNDGLFSTLTAYGQTIVNNPTFGLANHAVKADFSCPLGIEIIESKMFVYPNPVDDVLIISIEQLFNEINVFVIDLSGKIRKTSNEAQVDMSELEQGIYLIKVVTDNNERMFKVVR